MSLEVRKCMDPLTPTGIEPGWSPFVCFAKNELESESDGGGDDLSESKEFSKKDVERIVKSRIKKFAERAERAESKLQELTAQFDEFKASLEEKQSEAIEKAKGKEAAEAAKLQRQLERLSKQLEKVSAERDEWAKKAESVQGKMKSTELSRTLTDAFLKSGGLPKSARHAVQAFIADTGATLEFDEEGRPTIVATVGGTPFENDEIPKAMSRWLQTEAPHFAKAPQPGPGSKGNGGNGFLPQDKMEKMPVDALLAHGLKTPAPTAVSDD